MPVDPDDGEILAKLVPVPPGVCVGDGVKVAPGGSGVEVLVGVGVAEGRGVEEATVVGVGETGGEVGSVLDTKKLHH